MRPVTISEVLDWVEAAPPHKVRSALNRAMLWARCEAHAASFLAERRAWRNLQYQIEGVDALVRRMA